MLPLALENSIVLVKRSPVLLASLPHPITLSLPPSSFVFSRSCFPLSSLPIIRPCPPQSSSFALLLQICLSLIIPIRIFPHWLRHVFVRQTSVHPSFINASVLKTRPCPLPSRRFCPPLFSHDEFVSSFELFSFSSPPSPPLPHPNNLSYTPFAPYHYTPLFQAFHSLSTSSLSLQRSASAASCNFFEFLVQYTIYNVENLSRETISWDMVIQRTRIVLWNVPSEECRHLLVENYRPLVELLLRGNFWLDLMRDTKMKMNLIGEKSLRHARNIIQGWKSSTNIILL